MMISSTTIPKGIWKALQHIDCLDHKLREIREEMEGMRRGNAALQPKPAFSAMVDKGVEIQKQKAKIWNEKLRNQVVPGTTKSFWNLAVENNLGVRVAGPETLLELSAISILKLIPI